jgi:hypothetical protein
MLLAPVALRIRRKKGGRKLGRDGLFFEELQETERKCYRVQVHKPKVQFGVGMGRAGTWSPSDTGDFYQRRELLSF